MSSIPATHRAIVYEAYGEPSEVLNLQTIPLREIKDDEVLVRVHSAGVNPVDWKLHTGYLDPEGQNAPTSGSPRQLGFDVSGEIVQIGQKVQDFKVKDEVYAMASFMAQGTMAEYFIAQQDLIALKPKSLSHDQASSLPLVALTSYQALFRYGKLQAKNRVLVLNGSGGTGSMAIQIAHAEGAFVATTTSHRNVEYVKSLGADQVIDYTKEDFVDVLKAGSFDIVYDCIHGTEDIWEKAQQVLQPQGHFITLVPRTPVNWAPLTPDSKIHFHHILVEPNGKELAKISEYVDKKEIVSNVHDTFPLEATVKALQVSQASRTRGKLVIQVIPASP